MKPAAFIAKRYFFSRYHTQAVNLISAMAVLGVAVGTAALIVVLSAFNGLEDLVGGFYQKFDPDLKISPVQGKTMVAPTQVIDQVLANKGMYALVLEEKALLQNGDRQYIATLKGVDQNYREVTAVDENLMQGFYFEQQEEPVPTVLGAGVAYYLSLSSTQTAQPIEVIVPKPGTTASPDPRESFNQGFLYPTGIFSIQPDFDVQYVLCPLAFAQGMLEKQEVSAIEIKVKDPGELGAIQRDLQAALGTSYKVQNRLEQQAMLFKVMKSEGLVTYLVFSLILAIASFSILGALTMLMLDKKDQLHTLQSLGMTTATIQRIFLYEGLLITIVGAGIGLALGVLVFWLQDQFGLVVLGQGYVVESYPVSLRFWDLPKVLGTVVLLGGSITWIASRRVRLG